jgi:hypothetical protein
MVKPENKKWILDYFDAKGESGFGVYIEDGEYYYIYEDKEPIKVHPIASLEYDINHLPNDGQDELWWLFDCFCSGEYVHDEGISYYWFDVVEEGE